MGRARLRRAGRRALDRNRTLREVAALARWPRLRRTGMPDLAHLAGYEEGPMEGAIQRDEALLLHALVRVVRPRTVLELGFFRGDSSFNFLRALDPEARLYSFDIDPACSEVAERRFGHDPRFSFRVRSQDALTSDDLDGRAADIVFVDAAHDLALNQATFERLLPLMAPRATVAVHDTGGIPRDLLGLGDDHWMLTKPEIWAGDEWEHQPGERAFVNWILEAHPEFAQIHLHSRHAMRAGLTLVQRTAPLPRPPSADT